MVLHSFVYRHVHVVYSVFIAVVFLLAGLMKHVLC